MRKAIVVALLCVASTSTAWADQGVGIGLFVGEPLGLDLKLGLGFRSNLDIVLGWDTYLDGRDAYGHVTYLATLGVARGQSVSVPFRLGIGAAVYDDGSFALAILIWLAVVRWVTPRFTGPSGITAVVLFAGLALILAESVTRYSRRKQ